MTYRGSVSQDEMRRLARETQSTSISCTKEDKTAGSAEHSLKENRKHTHDVDACVRHSLHRRIFKMPYQRKRAAEEQRKSLNTQLRQKFVSPSDSLLSPCSRKLNDHKSKLFAAKSQPKRLDFAHSKQNILNSPNTDTEIDNDEDGHSEAVY
ncbi:AIS_HP2_G0020960.mRNA.1.CDS.1 [Saccharomyces cerevisiae]|nr:AIS_HP2_G0020960.mRNA.1.CDS.1 [Saccharomyces cerevisiae]CAI6532509.1 AIS_HP2_G0020960.mRNA.1.CDS.1 [Saccharomyces cerevisiae]